MTKKIKADSKTSKKPKKLSLKAVRMERALQVTKHAGRTFPAEHHVLIAKLKRGEVWALNHLKPQAKARVTPLFEMWPPTPGTPEKPAKTVQTHVNDLMQLVQNEWGALPAFIDTRYMPAGGPASATEADLVFASARAHNLNVVPVTRLDASPAYQAVIRNTIATDGRGVMIRLRLSDFNNPSLTADYLNGMLTVLSVAPQNVDILIDLEHRPDEAEVRQLGASCLAALPSLNTWRTVTIAAGCVPSLISNIPHGQWTPLVRSDWRGWSTIYSNQLASGLRRPSFGDYGVRCGGVPQNIPVIPDPNLRYSDSNHVHVVRGTKALGTLAAMCQSLIASTIYRGQNFSEGDSALHAKAAMPSSSKNSQAEYWIQWCTNHHLEQTSEQIQNLP